MKVQLPSFALAENLKIPEEPGPPAPPPGATIPEIIEGLALGKWKVPRQQERFLLELAPAYFPKLSSVAVGYVTGNDHARALDRAIERSNGARVINAKALPPPVDDERATDLD
jgi:hypothetical protein